MSISSPQRSTDARTTDYQSSPEASEYAKAGRRTAVGGVLAVLPFAIATLIVVAPFVALGVALGLVAGVAAVPLVLRLRRGLTGALRRRRARTPQS